MTKTLPRPASIAHQWLAAFNDHDLDSLLALYDDDAQHYSPKLKVSKPETDGLIKGKDALRLWWQDAFQRLPTLRYIATTITGVDDRVWMEYTRSVSGEENMNVAEVLEISHGKIVASRVYHG